MPLNEPKRYVEIDPSQLRADHEAKVIEQYTSGTTVTYEGKICRVGDEVAKFSTRAEGLGVTGAWIVDRDDCRVKAFIVPPQLPDTFGTVIKFYDYKYLRNRVAFRGPDGEWYSAEIPSEPLGPIAPVEWTVLFDPQKDR